MRAAQERGETLNLTEEEIAFYDALNANGSAQEMIEDAQLRVIAREVADTVRKNITIDWQLREQARANLREQARANLRVLVKKVLRKHGYPPDKAEQASQTVLEQAELFAQAVAG